MAGTAFRGGVPGVFPNDSNLRGRNRKLQRELPSSNGNPRQIGDSRSRSGGGITPENLSPSRILDGPAGSYGLPHNDGKGQ
jgi:hypothetical protein